MNECIVCGGKNTDNTEMGCPVCGKSPTLPSGVSEHEEDMARDMGLLGRDITDLMGKYLVSKAAHVDSPKGVADVLSVTQGALIMAVVAHFRFCRSIGMGATIEDFADDYKRMITKYGGA